MEKKYQNKKCLMCRKELTGLKTKFCNDKCRKNYQYRLKNPNRFIYDNGVKKICNQCGKEFITYYEKARFCSKKCNNKHWYLENKIETKLICKECKVEFIRTHGGQLYCSKSCRGKASYKRNKENINKYQREHRIKRDYGISSNQFDKLKNLNNNTCWICGRPNKMKLCVDHDHETNDIRGLLCHNCNKALGIVNDNPLILIKMVHYLKQKPILFNQSTKEIIEEIGDSTTFLQRFEINPNILSVNLK